MIRSWGLVATCVAALTTAARAQDTAVVDAGMFRLWQGSLEALRESLRETRTSVEGTSQVPLARLTLRWRFETDAAGRLVRGRMSAHRLPGDSLVRTYTVEAAGDSLHLEQTDPGREPRRWAKAASADALLPEQSVAAIAWLIARAGRRDTLFRVWSAGADSALPLTIAFRGDSAILTVATLRMAGAVGPGGRISTLLIPAQAARAERFRGDIRGDSLPPMRGMDRPAPDYSAPAGAGYAAEDVRIPVRPATGDTFSLGCTLTKPAAARGRLPAAITLTGSGQQDRDENLWPLVPEYRLFRQVAVRLAAAGIAVLRCDDRGVYASGGPLDSVTIPEFVDDAAAQLAWLRARPDIDERRLAIIGHSEGGMTGPILAARDHAVRALVVMAGPAKSMRLVVRDQFAWPVLSNPDLPPVQRDSMLVTAQQQADAFVNRPMPYLRWAGDWDPLPTARRVRTPVLILQGALDRQVTAGQADTLAAAIRGAGNRDVTVRVFPRLNHLFLVSPTNGAPAEYPALTDTAVPAAVLELLATWLAARLQR